MRCLDARNNTPVWPKLVAAGYPACRLFIPTEKFTQETSLCHLMML